jgi:hypothetical protein
MRFSQINVFFSLSIVQFLFILMFLFSSRVCYREDPRWIHRIHEALRPSLRPAFSEIYSADKWNSGAQTFQNDSVTRAGPGSSLIYTEKVRLFLGDFIKQRNIKTVADLSCNELLWQPLIPGFSELKLFSGFDIVPGAIQLAKDRVSKLQSPTIELAVMDMTSESLSRAFDLVIVRDTFFHLPLTDVMSALSLIEASGSQYLGTTTIDDPKLRNTFILSGEWYPMNLYMPPFLFPEPILWVVEGIPGVDYYGKKKFGIWKLPLELKMELTK